MRVHASDVGESGGVRGQVDYGGVNASPSPTTMSPPAFHGRSSSGSLGLHGNGATPRRGIPFDNGQDAGPRE